MVLDEGRPEEAAGVEKEVDVEVELPEPAAYGEDIEYEPPWEYKW